MGHFPGADESRAPWLPDRLPLVAGRGINFSYTTPPKILLDDATPADPLQVITPNLFPGVSISADLGNGPGAAGGVLLRPFARLIASTGDSVTTHGEPWNVN